MAAATQPANTPAKIGRQACCGALGDVVAGHQHNCASRQSVGPAQ